MDLSGVVGRATDDALLMLNWISMWIQASATFNGMFATVSAGFFFFFGGGTQKVVREF